MSALAYRGPQVGRGMAFREAKPEQGLLPEPSTALAYDFFRFLRGPQKVVAQVRAAMAMPWPDLRRLE